MTQLTHPLGLASCNVFLMEGKVGLCSGDSSQQALTRATIFSSPLSPNRDGRSGTGALGSLMRLMISEIIWGLDEQATKLCRSTQAVQMVMGPTNLKTKFKINNIFEFQDNLDMCVSVLDLSRKLNSPMET